MRLFVAINFPKQVTDYLEQTMSRLRKETVKGSFTRVENLHLTIAFLGEVAPANVEEIIMILRQVTERREPFSIEVGGFGKFVNRGERLYWCRVSECEELTLLQEKLLVRLKEKGYSVDEKPFKPHITLARRCVMKESFKEATFAKTSKPVIMQVLSIHLMLSMRKEGKLVYRSLGEAKFT